MQVMHMSPVDETCQLSWSLPSSLRPKLTSIGDSSNRGIEEWYSTAVRVEVDTVEASSLSAVVVHLDAVGRSERDQLSLHRERAEKQETHQASPSLALTLPSVNSSNSALLINTFGAAFFFFSFSPSAATAFSASLES